VKGFEARLHVASPPDADGSVEVTVRGVERVVVMLVDETDSAREKDEFPLGPDVFTGFEDPDGRFASGSGNMATFFEPPTGCLLGVSVAVGGGGSCCC